MQIDSALRSGTIVVTGCVAKMSVVPPIPPDFVCPILHEVMRNPMVASDGYSYEEAAIQQWFQRAPDRGGFGP